MAQVPDNETFSLFDILDAVYGSHASGNLSEAFTASDAAKFDSDYGSKTMDPKTMLGFRNYGAVPAIPTATAATAVICKSFTANWNASAGATGYYLFVSLYSNFSSHVTGYQQLDVGNVTSYGVDGLTENTVYYYRLMAYNGSGVSYASDIISTTTICYGYDDWWLPDTYKLIEMRNSLYLNNKGGFSARAYWSIQECTYNNHYATNFADGVSYCRSNDNVYVVRAYRQFTAGINVYNVGDRGPAGGWIFYKGGGYDICEYREASPADLQENNISNAAYACQNLIIYN